MLTANMETTMINPDDPQIRKKSRRALLWFGMVSIVMLFAGLTSGYLVRQGEGKWVEFSIPNFFIFSTIVLLLSSLPMQLALKSVRKNDTKNLKTALLLTLGLGITFVVFQYLAWSELYHNGIAFVSTIGDIKTNFTYIPSGTETAADAAGVGNVAASFLYVLTALHVLHLIAGLLVLSVVLGKALRNKYSAENYNGVSMCAIYWHFMDGLWVYLFFFLLYIR